MPAPTCCNRHFILLIGLLLTGLAAGAQSETNQLFRARAQAAFQLAQTNYIIHTNNPAIACQYASACFDLTDYSTNDTERAKMAQLGIDACRQVLAADPKSAPGHYYLAMNLGELAQAEAPSLAAYRLVHEVEHEFKTAGELDERLDHAGPARNLGELYFQAPGWPLSIGNKHKAKELLERAVVLAPDWPENQLNLLEARLKWRQRTEAAATIKTLKTLWPTARLKYAGPDYDRDWVDWPIRRTALETEFYRLYPPGDQP